MPRAASKTLTPRSNSIANRLTLPEPSFADRVKYFFGFPVKASTLSSVAAATIMKPSANYQIGVEAQFENLVRFGWRRNEVIFACISKTAKTASQVEMKAYARGTKTELPDEKIKKLIQRPNPEMSEYDFWSCIITYQKLAGVAYFEKERNFAGEVINLWPLRPDWVKARMSNAVEVESYRYQPSGSSDYADLDPTNVLVFRLWDPMGLFSTWPPAAVAARAGEIDNETTDMIKAFIQEGGLPIGLLSAQGRLRDEQIEEIRARWRIRYGGWKKWLDPAVLDNGATYQRMGLTFEEMGFEGLDSRNETRICMALDVPPILVSAKSGLDRATYSNYKEARQAWWEDSLIPLYSDFMDVVINQLLPDFDDTGSIEMRWDFSRVPVMQEEMAARRDQAIKGLASGGITVNEFRELFGLAGIGPEGEVFIRSSSQTPVPMKPTAAKSRADVKTPPCRQSGESRDDCVSRKIPEIQAENPNMSMDQCVAIAESMCSHNCSEGGKSGCADCGSNGKVHEHEAKAESASTDPERRKREDELTEIMMEYFKEQEKRLLEEVDATSA